MKVFMITWGLLCLFIIAGLFIAYTTDNLPGAPTKLGQDELEAEMECSPCEENLKRLKEAMERWERERKAAAVTASDTQ